MSVKLEALAEETPGRKWQRLQRRFWPAYRRWYYDEDADQRPGRLIAEQRLRQAMPELFPVYRHLVRLAGNDGEVARFLTLYRPAPYLAGCSQAVWTAGEPVLIRNYDYSPRLWEAVLVRTRWADRSILGMSDCLWGLLDGVNDAGVAVSLAFGGRRIVGDGFGSPLILRYVLECAATAEQARQLLLRVPTHMPYNVTVVDAAGDHFTALLAPDRPPEISRRPVATNHQGVGESTPASSLEREEVLTDKLAEDDVSLDALIETFQEPPVLADRYDQAAGTLYTAIYFPARRRMKLLWPGRSVDFSLDGFRERKVEVPIPVGEET